MPSQPTERIADARPRNRVLASLPDDEYARLAAVLQGVSLDIRDLVYDVDVPISHVYFPNTAVVSVIGVMADGSAVETATVGCEGMVGLAVFNQTDRASTQAFCQVAGSALRMTSADFRREIARAPGLTSTLHRYTQAVFAQMAQASACNRIHPVRQRCARWLLMTHDRVGKEDFLLTHEFLAQMLGVRRASVSEAAALLQQLGAITYVYGKMTIRDRAALEGAACECYRIVAREYDRLLGGGAAARPSAPFSSEGKTTLGQPNVRGDEME